MSSERRNEGGGLSIKTLLSAAAASAIASLVVPQIWETGTIFAAATTPVVVALVSETLKRPVDAVSSVRVRRTPGGAAILDRPALPRSLERESFDPLAPAPTDEIEAALLASQARPPRRVESRRPLSARQWKLALLTGLVAFFVAATVVTASELAVFGDSISRGDQRTTYFGGNHHAPKTTDEDEQERGTPTPSASPTATKTPTPTPTPRATPTRTATPTPTPRPKSTPTATATPRGVAPTSTPAPAPTQTTAP